MLANDDVLIDEIVDGTVLILMHLPSFSDIVRTGFLQLGIQKVVTNLLATAGVKREGSVRV